MEQTLTTEQLNELAVEVGRARSKFSNNRLMLAALMEEVGELANAIIEGKDWETEALQVACVAMRIYTEGDSTHGLTPRTLAAIGEGQSNRKGGANDNP